MKIWVGMTAAAIALAVAGCATEDAKKEDSKTAAASKTLDAKALQLVFKAGGGQCKWEANGAKGEDNYFATVSKSKGEVDRYIGDKTEQGKWEIKGDKFCLDFGKEECSTFEQVDKGKYKATYGGKTYNMSC